MSDAIFRHFRSCKFHLLWFGRSFCVVFCLTLHFNLILFLMFLFLYDQMLSQSLLEGLRQSRLFLTSRRVEARRRERARAMLAESSSMLAQQRACEILNITETDLTDIMSVSGHNDSDEVLWWMLIIIIPHVPFW